ncbi:MAG: PilZ domain-containing protein [Acidobacteria bacterium]|nr:PilZ domain-containing protein [Acidobacteriota bacterium]
MTQGHSSNDRRRYPRHQLRNGLSVELRVEVSGDKPAILLTRGKVADISCGGLKCYINLNVPVGTRVDVCFQEASNTVLAPQLMDGRVVRTESLGGVPDQVAIAFAHPLECLDLDQFRPDEVAAPLRGRTAAKRLASWADEPHSFPTVATGNLL